MKKVRYYASARRSSSGPLRHPSGKRNGRRREDRGLCSLSLSKLPAVPAPYGRDECAILRTPALHRSALWLAGTSLQPDVSHLVAQQQHQASVSHVAMWHQRHAKNM